MSAQAPSADVRPQLQGPTASHQRLLSRFQSTALSAGPTTASAQQLLHQYALTLTRYPALLPLTAAHLTAASARSSHQRLTAPRQRFPFRFQSPAATATTRNVGAQLSPSSLATTPTSTPSSPLPEAATLGAASARQLLTHHALLQRLLSKKLLTAPTARPRSANVHQTLPPLLIATPTRS